MITALQEQVEEKSLIEHFFTKDMLKKLHYHSCRVDIPDNNIKAEMITELLGPDFHEIGTGTNRIAYYYNGFVVKIALDYRGWLGHVTSLIAGTNSLG